MLLFSVQELVGKKTKRKGILMANGNTILLLRPEGDLSNFPSKCLFMIMSSGLAKENLSMFNLVLTLLHLLQKVGSHQILCKRMQHLLLLVVGEVEAVYL